MKGYEELDDDSKKKFAALVEETRKWLIAQPGYSQISRSIDAILAEDESREGTK